MAVTSVTTLPATGISYNRATFNMEYCVNTEDTYSRQFGWRGDEGTFYLTGQVGRISSGGCFRYSVPMYWLVGGQYIRFYSLVRKVPGGRWKEGEWLGFQLKEPPVIYHFRAYGKAGDGLIYKGEDNIVTFE